MEISRLRPDLRDRFPASIAPTDVLRRLTDKARFAETLAELDIPHPRTTLLRDIRVLDSVPDEAIATSFLKPANSGRFSAIYHVKAMRPQNRAQAQALVSEAAGRGLELMLQEFIPGPPTLHCFVDGFMDRKGRVCGMLARRRIRMFPADFGNSTFTETIPLDGVRRRGRVAEAAAGRDRVSRRLQRRVQARRRATASSRSSRSTPGPGGTSALRRTAASTSATWPIATRSARTSSP